MNERYQLSSLRREVCSDKKLRRLGRVGGKMRMHACKGGEEAVKFRKNLRTFYLNDPNAPPQFLHK